MYQPAGPSAAIKVAVKTLADHVHLSAGGRGYVIYGMLDPRKSDPCGQYKNKLVYVGMTQDIGTRIRRRYHDAFDGKSRFTPSIQLIRELAVEGLVPAFEVLERVASKADVVIAETVWAQRLLSEGHHLINQAGSQRKLLSMHDLAGVLQNRLWRLTIHEAIEGGLRVATTCHWCGRVGQLNPADFLAYTRPAERMCFVRQMASRCVLCGTLIDHMILRRHEPDAAIRAGIMEWED